MMYLLLIELISVKKIMNTYRNKKLEIELYGDATNSLLASKARFQHTQRVDIVVRCPLSICCSYTYFN